LTLADGRRLCFADVRTFGRMRLVEPGEGWDAALGLEPLSPSFTTTVFADLLAGRAMPIKSFPASLRLRSRDLVVRQRA